ncbi:MAG: hypothetical protein QM820_22765 [Minicystis sp.]
MQCLTADTCPGQDDECKKRACNNGTCAASFTAMGTAISVQSAGDCKKAVCDGNGGVTAVADDSDVQDDGNSCTGDSCSGGVPQHPPVAQGTSCGPNKTCNASGSCVGCVTASDCPGQDNACQTRACNGGVCSINYVPSGTPVGAQAAGDCKKNACNGSGAIVQMVDDTDVPVDGVACTSDVCSNGSPSNPAAPAGTSCGTGVCNGAGSCGVCTPGDIKFCCVTKSSACCYANPAAKPPDASYPDENPDENPDIICCCDGTSDCDASGQWTGCY